MGSWAVSWGYVGRGSSWGLSGQSQPTGGHQATGPWHAHTHMHTCWKGWLERRGNKKPSLCPGCIVSCISTEGSGLGYVLQKSGRKKLLCSLSWLIFFLWEIQVTVPTLIPAATGRFLRALERLSRPAALFPLKAMVVLQFSEGRVWARKSGKDLKVFLGWSP